MDGPARRDLILKLADLIDRDSEFLEALESLDNGKPMGREGQYGTSADVSLTSKCFRYFAGWADKLHGKTIPVEGNFLCYTQREPVGVCGCIIPWNFPLVRFLLYFTRLCCYSAHVIIHLTGCLLSYFF